VHRPAQEIKAASGLTFAAIGVLAQSGLDKAVETVLHRRG
jgi:hypothetical protein